MKKQNKISNGVKIEINNQANYKIDLKLVRKVVSAFGRAYKIYPVKSPLKRGMKQFNEVNNNQEISLAFVSDAEIKKINNTYRGLNQITDVLSFAPLNSAEGNLTGQAGDGDYLGEIIIDYSQIKRQAGNFKTTVRQELIFILVHGLLHLIGYDDKTDGDREKMIKLGEEFIKKLKM